MREPIRSDEQPHDEAEALLPWYATGQLDAADGARVESHLATCARCQRQLNQERRVMAEFQALNPEFDAGWNRLRSRIERPVYRPSRIALAANELWALLSRPAVAALATAQVAFLIFAVIALPMLNRPVYQALGAREAPHAANLIVMFRPDAREADIRGALRASGASLVGGPTSTDAYLLHVPANARSSALAELRADKEISLAQPIDDSSR